MTVDAGDLIEPESVNAASSQTDDRADPSGKPEAADTPDVEAAAPGAAQGPGPSGRKVAPGAGQELSAGEG